MKIRRVMTTLFVAVALAACQSLPASVPQNVADAPPAALATSVVTAAPTEVPATITPTQIASLPGPCQNPLMPLHPGARWQYQTVNPTGSFDYTIEALDLRKDRTQTIGLRFTSADGKVKDEDALCENGAIVNYPNYNMDMLFANQLQQTLNLVHMQGDALPGYEALQQAGWQLAWQTVYQTEEGAVLADPTTGAAINIDSSSDVDMEYRLTGVTERITTPAGSWDCLVVEHAFTFLVTIPAVFTNSAAATLRVETTQWIAPNVGLVQSSLRRAVIRSGGLESEVPLTGTLTLMQVDLPQ